MQEAKTKIADYVIEEELRNMFTKKQFCILLGIPQTTTISKKKLARTLVLKWKVENNE